MTYSAEIATALEASQTWPVDAAACAVVTRTGETLASVGDVTRVFPLASVTKLLTAYTVLIAVEEGVFELETPAGPEGSTVRHLLAHVSGLDFGEWKIRAAPGERRIYSNEGFVALADALTTHSGIAFAEYAREALLEPLGMSVTTIDGHPGAGARSSVSDLSRFAAELQRPTLIHESTLVAATSVVFPGLDGVLPGYGVQRPNDWGLGFEVRSAKQPHWTGHHNSTRTFGHFGQTGTFLWVDPEVNIATIALTDRNFGQWAIDVWPGFSDAVLEAHHA